MLVENDEGRIAFGRYILAHHATVHEFVLGLTGNLPNHEEVAREIVQECYLRALKYFSSFTGDDVVPWLRTIALNTFLTWKRRECADQLTYMGLRIGSAPGSPEPLWCTECKNPERLVSTEIDRRRLLAMIAALPIASRRILLLREVEGLTYGEIAVVVGVPIGTVMSRLARARAMLRQMWLEMGGMRTEQLLTKMQSRTEGSGD